MKHTALWRRQSWKCKAGRSSSCAPNKSSSLHICHQLKVPCHSAVAAMTQAHAALGPVAPSWLVLLLGAALPACPDSSSWSCLHSPEVPHIVVQAVYQFSGIVALSPSDTKAYSHGGSHLWQKLVHQLIFREANLPLDHPAQTGLSSPPQKGRKGTAQKKFGLLASVWECSVQSQNAESSRECHTLLFYWVVLTQMLEKQFAQGVGQGLVSALDESVGWPARLEAR
eukprot:3338517-Rhodomonas_salina.3